MGKKAKTKAGKLRAENRKVNTKEIPPPPPLEDEIGSKKLLKEPKAPGSLYKTLDQDGYDDGGVGDLSLVMDLEDYIVRRKRGDADYQTAYRNDMLPRIKRGNYAQLQRRDQKIQLAQMLFGDGETEEGDTKASEVYMDNERDVVDEATKKQRLERLNVAKQCLEISYILREVACQSLSLSEISKRHLSLKGKDGAEDALRCATKAVEIASEGFYDNDEIVMEAQKEPKVDPKFEKNATFYGLGHPKVLLHQPERVSDLCLRSAYLHMGNALSALGRNDEARDVYAKVLPMLENEPRCGRLDWERCSVLVNIGNTFSREGNFAQANENYNKAEKLGQDHLGVSDGNHSDGYGLVIEAMRARSFALKRDGKDEEGKAEMRKVLETQLKKNEADEKMKALSKELEEKQKKEEEAAIEKMKEEAQKQQNAVAVAVAGQ